MRPPGGGVGGAFPSWWGRRADRRSAHRDASVPSEKEKRKRRIRREPGRAPAAVVFPGGQGGREDSPCLEGLGPEGSRNDLRRGTEERKGEPGPAGRSSKEITQGAALGDTEEEERMPCTRRELERGHSGRCPGKEGRG